MNGPNTYAPRRPASAYLSPNDGRVLRDPPAPYAETTSMTKHDLLAASQALLEFASGLVPGALGAAVATAYERGIPWLQRLTQLAVGIIVSYFGGRVFDALLPHTHEFVRQGVTFSIGLVAYNAVPGFIKSFANTLQKVPGDLWDWIKSWFKRGPAA